MNDISINPYLNSNSHISRKDIPELPCAIQDAICLTFQPQDDGIFRDSILDFMNIIEMIMPLHIVSVKWLKMVLS